MINYSIEVVVRGMSKTKKLIYALIFCAVFAFVGGFAKQARADATITGKITKTDGTPVEDIRVYAYKDNQYFASDDSTDANGDYTITIPSAVAAGVYAVKTAQYIYVYDMGTARGHYEYYYIQENKNVSVTDGVAAPNINFSLTKKGAVSGKITDSNGQPINNVQTVFWNYFSGSSSFYGYNYAYTNEMGNYYTSPFYYADYDYNRPVPGTYRAYISAPGYLPKYIEGIQITDNQAATLNASLIRKSTINGRVTDANGGALANVSVQLYREGEASAHSATTTDVNGNYSLEVGRSGNYWSFGDFSSIGKYIVEAAGDTDSSYVKKSAKVSITSEESTKTKNFKLQMKDASISGRITNKNGTAISHARVTAGLLKDPRVTEFAYSDADGNYSVAGLEKGTYYLTVYKAGYINIDISKIKIGKNTKKNFKLSPAGIISGYVFDKTTNKPLYGVVVRLVNSDLLDGTDSNGYYKIANVPPGKRKVFIRDISYIEQFYKNADQYKKAKIIKVKAKQERKNVNFYLMPYSKVYGK